jgi:hypothetical protein
MKKHLETALLASVAACLPWQLALAQTSGLVEVWGNNSYSQAASPSNLVATAVAAGLFHTLAIRPNGTVAAWGESTRGQTKVPSGLKNVIAVAAGETHSVALKSNGTVACWGSSDLRKVPTNLRGVIAISAGPLHTVVLKGDGTVAAWGPPMLSTIVSVPAGLTIVVAAAVGYQHTLALKGDGSVVAWGENGSGQTNVPPGLSGVIAVAAGGWSSIALKSNGTVVAWGAEAQKLPPGLSNVKAIAAGKYHTLALKHDGTVVAWGSDDGSLGDFGESRVPAGLTGVVAVATSKYSSHSLALKSDGTAVGWGANVDGRATVPTGLTGITAIATGQEFSVAIGAPMPRPPPSGQTEWVRRETQTGHQFLLIDEVTDDKIVIDVAKIRGGLAGRVKQVSYFFGRSPLWPELPSGTVVHFTPNLNGLPARISGWPSRAATTTFTWKSDFSSVSISTGSGARRGVQGMPPYLKSMVNGDFLGLETVGTAAENGKLASWLAEVVDTVSTWAYAAAQVSVDGFGEEGVFAPVAMDPNRTKTYPLAHYACRFIGGMRPDQAKGPSSFASRVASSFADEGEVDMMAAGAASTARQPSFSPFGYPIWEAT